MGRTTNTFRMRTLKIRDRMMSLLGGKIDENTYKSLWERINMLSSAASIFNWPDTSAVLTYCMLLDIMAKLDKLEQMN